MRYWQIFVIFLFFYSCDYFDKKKVNADDLLYESLQSFNWNEVDEYPIFESCDSSVSKAEKKACFENVLTTSIYEQLKQSQLIVTETLNDTLFLDFEISSSGQIDYVSSSGNPIIFRVIPNIDSIIKSSLTDLPNAYPALKRGQQVKTAFKIPLVLQTD